MADGKGNKTPYVDVEAGGTQPGGTTTMENGKHVFKPYTQQEYQSDWQRAIRMGFIRKVYGILMCQLLVFFGGIALAVEVDSVRATIQDNVAFMWIAYVVMIITVCMLACCRKVARTVPMNYVVLATFTLSATFFTAVLSSFYATRVVLLAIGVTLSLFFMLTLYACQTKYDYTMMGGMLFCGMWMLIMFGFLSWLWAGPITNVIYGCIGALLMCFFIIYDTQLIVGGRHKLQFSEDDYIYASLNLFMDVFNLFLYILMLLGGSRRR